MDKIMQLLLTSIALLIFISAIAVAKPQGDPAGAGDTTTADPAAAGGDTTTADPAAGNATTADPKPDGANSTAAGGNATAAGGGKTTPAGGAASTKHGNKTEGAEVVQLTVSKLFHNI